MPVPIVIRGREQTICNFSIIPPPHQTKTLQSPPCTGNCPQTYLHTYAIDDENIFVECRTGPN